MEELTWMQINFCNTIILPMHDNPKLRKALLDAHVDNMRQLLNNKIREKNERDEFTRRLQGRTTFS